MLTGRADRPTGAPADAAADGGPAEASGTSSVTKEAVHQLQVNEKIMAGQGRAGPLGPDTDTLTHCH